MTLNFFSLVFLCCSSPPKRWGRCRADLNRGLSQNASLPSARSPCCSHVSPLRNIKTFCVPRCRSLRSELMKSRETLTWRRAPSLRALEPLHKASERVRCVMILLVQEVWWLVRSRTIRVRCSLLVTHAPQPVWPWQEAFVRYGSLVNVPCYRWSGCACSDVLLYTVLSQILYLYMFVVIV